MYNYATKADLKGVGAYLSNLGAKSDLASLEADVSKIDIDKIKNVPASLSNLGNVVDNDVITKTVYDQLVTKGNVIDSSQLVKNADYT